MKFAQNATKYGDLVFAKFDTSKNEAENLVVHGYPFMRFYHKNDTNFWGGHLWKEGEPIGKNRFYGKWERMGQHPGVAYAGKKDLVKIEKWIKKKYKRLIK